MNRRLTKSGGDPIHIPDQSRPTLDGARHRYAHEVFDRVDSALRIHCRLVLVHWYPKVNGRASRMLADHVLVATHRDPLPVEVQVTTRQG